MKKIIDFMVAVYTLIMPQKYGIKRVEAGIYILTILILLNSYSIVSFTAPFWNFFLQTTDIVIISFIVVVLPTIIVGFIGRWYLEKHYLNIREYKKILRVCSKISRIMAIILVIIHYIVSVFIFFYCLGYLPYAPLSIG